MLKTCSYKEAKSSENITHTGKQANKYNKHHNLAKNKMGIIINNKQYNKY